MTSLLPAIAASQERRPVALLFAQSRIDPHEILPDDISDELPVIARDDRQMRDVLLR